MKFYFVAGERSGDLHGGNLIRSLRTLTDKLDCRGFGGDHMESAGMEVVVHYCELAFMGFAEVIANLRTISKKIKECKQDILEFKPDVVVLIDYAGFNLRIAKFAKQNGFKVFWYISPKVWAWNQKRALKLKRLVDKMFVILPFEKSFYKKFDWEVDYVGNPVLDAVKAYTSDDQFLTKNDLQGELPLVALLPGSRKQEVKLIVPLFYEIAHALPNVQFGVATVDNLLEGYYQSLTSLPNVKLIAGATYDLLSHARAAIVTSGTATLETALFRIPQVVVYKATSISYAIAKSVIQVPFISLVNLIAEREVIKELIQGKANLPGALNELQLILSDENYRDKMVEGYDKIINVLDTGSASDNTAKLMIEYLQPDNHRNHIS